MAVSKRQTSCRAKGQNSQQDKRWNKYAFANCNFGGSPRFKDYFKDKSRTWMYLMQNRLHGVSWTSLPPTCILLQNPLQGKPQRLFLLPPFCFPFPFFFALSHLLLWRIPARWLWWCQKMLHVEYTILEAPFCRPEYSVLWFSLLSFAVLCISFPRDPK